MTNFDYFIYNIYLDILIKRLPDGHSSLKIYYLDLIYA